jgi:hypothetical protein
MVSLRLRSVYLRKKQHPVRTGLVRFQNRSGSGEKEKLLLSLLGNNSGLLNHELFTWRGTGKIARSAENSVELRRMNTESHM